MNTVDLFMRTLLMMLIQVIQKVTLIIEIIEILIIMLDFTDNLFLTTLWIFFILILF